jgi:hypothetical protein
MVRERSGNSTWMTNMATRIKRPTSAELLPLPTPPPLPPNASLGRRWRFRRDLVIYISSRNGVSQRLLADVFDLPRSRVAAIIKDFGALCGHYTS